MRDALLHVNVVRFYGLTELDTERYVIGEYCNKGSMVDIIQNVKWVGFVCASACEQACFVVFESEYAYAYQLLHLHATVFSYNKSSLIGFTDNYFVCTCQK